jgi:hypothetical protein
MTGAWGDLKPEHARIEPGCPQVGFEIHLHVVHRAGELLNGGAVGGANAKDLAGWNVDFDLVPLGTGMPKLRMIRLGIEEGDSLRDTNLRSLDDQSKAILEARLGILLPRDAILG